MPDIKFFRPEWTCGRYNPQKHVAIYYNLIEGISYFFEDESADVVGAILDLGRNNAFTLDIISEKTSISIDNLLPFIEELRNLNLVTNSEITDEGIKQYRKALAQWKKENPLKLDKSTKEKLPYVESNTEMIYTERVGGITSVMFELTYNCSEKCIHCYNVGATHTDEDVNHRDSIKGLNLEDYKNIIDQLYEQGLFRVTLTGGDPFSNPLVWDIIDYLYKKEIGIDILTNGQKIVKEVSRLANYYPRSVGVSIYSSQPEIHDSITRIPGSWKKSIQVLEEMGNLSIPLNIKCCIMQPNFKSYKGVADIARRVGAHPQFEISVTDSIDGNKFVSQNLRMTPEQYEIILRDDNIPLYVGPEAPNYGGQKKDLNFKGCGAGDNSLCIRPDGEVIPCCAFHLKLGNIKKKSLYEILENPILREWRNFSLDKSEECGTHDYCDYCNLCFGNSYSEHGDYKKASENCCYIAKIRFDLAENLRIMDNENLYKNEIIYFLSNSSQALIDQVFTKYPDLMHLAGKELYENRLSKNSANIFISLFGSDFIKKLQDGYKNKGKATYPTANLSEEWEKEAIKKQLKGFMKQYKDK